MYESHIYDERGKSPSGYVPVGPYHFLRASWEIKRSDIGMFVLPHRCPWQLVLLGLVTTLLCSAVVICIWSRAGAEFGALSGFAMGMARMGIAGTTWYGQINASSTIRPLHIDRVCNLATRTNPQLRVSLDQIHSVELARYRIGERYQRSHAYLSDLVLVCGAVESPEHLLIGRQISNAHRLGKQLAAELGVPFVESVI